MPRGLLPFLLGFIVGTALAAYLWWPAFLLL